MPWHLSLSEMKKAYIREGFVQGKHSTQLLKEIGHIATEKREGMIHSRKD